MLFEWDEHKNKLNFQKHSISFEEGLEIFKGTVFTLEDNRKDYGEKRKISIGAIENIIIAVVVHTKRKDKVRIISARLANKTERKLYYEYLKEKD